jgi:hypothetical protein
MRFRHLPPCDQHRINVVSLLTDSALLLVDALPNPACTKLSAFAKCETFFRFQTLLPMKKVSRAMGIDRCLFRVEENP